MNNIRFRTGFLSATTAFALALVSASASATVLEAKGGPGGRPFNLTCPAGQYLVGFHARAGGWVDAVGIICAPYNATTRRLGDRIKDSRVTGGPGGGPQEIYCPVGEPIKAIGLAHTRGSGLDRQYVNTIDIYCENASLGTQPESCISSGEGCGFISSHTAGTIILRGVDYKYDEIKCPAEEKAIGVLGGSGSAIDSVGLICGPLTPASVPARPNSTPFSSMFAPGIDIPGSDYRSVVLNYSPTQKNNNQPVACQDLCMIEERCKACTYVKPGVQGTNAMCWLKAAVPGPVQNPNTVSGLKASGKTVVH